MPPLPSPAAAVEVEHPDRVDAAVRQLAGAWLASHASPNTRSAYRRDLTDWLGFCADLGVEPLAALRPHVDVWVRHLSEERRLAPSTVARRVAAIASFYRYAEELGVVAASPAARVRRPRTGEGHVELTPALSREELLALLAAARAAGPRDLVVVLLLAMNALRASEALALDLEDLHEVRGHVTVLVRGKGGTETRVPLPPPVVDAIDRLAAAEHRTTGPILRDANGQRMSRHSLARAVLRLGRTAGIPRPVRPHQLRATAITEALEAGVPLRDVQDLARHADPRTTRRYDRARLGLDRHAAYALAARFAG